MIIAVKRLKRLSKNQIQLPVFFKPLKTDTPILGVIHSIIESFIGQQNLVSQLKNTLWECEQSIGNLMQENKELRL